MTLGPRHLGTSLMYRTKYRRRRSPGNRNFALAWNQRERFLHLTIGVDMCGWPLRLQDSHLDVVASGLW